MKALRRPVATVVRILHCGHRGGQPTDAVVGMEDGFKATCSAVYYMCV
jgi:hypothetical protein